MRISLNGLDWLCKGYSDNDCAYQKSFPVDEALRGQRVRLVFDGLVASARVHLNGELLGESNGSFAPASFEVDGQLRYGEINRLVVMIPGDKTGPQTGASNPALGLTNRMSNGRDEPRRAAYLGLWGPVYLEATGLARIEEVWVQSVLSQDLQRGEVRISADLSAGWPVYQPPDFPSSLGPASRQFKAYPLEVEVEIELRIGGVRAAYQTTPCDIAYNGGRLHVGLHLDQPRLWWPNGYGEPELYEMEIRVLSPRLPGMSAGGVSDARVVQFGLRRLDLAPGKHPEGLIANGQRIVIRGRDWRPVDAGDGGDRPQELRKALDLAHHAGVNLLRVDGGTIEMEYFYELCDRNGVLICQALIPSIGWIELDPSDHRKFNDWVIAQARQNIRRQRNHPCLALWCDETGRTNLPGIPVEEPLLLAEHLMTALRELDPGRPWLQTLPSGWVVAGTSRDGFA